MSNKVEVRVEDDFMPMINLVVNGEEVNYLTPGDTLDEQLNFIKCFYESIKNGAEVSFKD